MPVSHVRYEVEGWGVGALWTDGERVVWHELPRARADGPPGEAHAHPLVARVQAWFGGEQDDFADVELDLDELSDFQRACVRVLRTLPRGEVVTYGELASLAGRPGAARAAGTFCARNRLSLFVPCHRVVGAGGIGSYGSFGIDYKRRLLALDGVTSL